MDKSSERKMYQDFRLVQIGEDNPGMDHVANYFEGFKAASVMMAACKIEIFDKLDELLKPAKVEDVAKHTGWPPQAIGRVLDALVSLKLVKKSQTQNGYVYSNTSAGACLRKNAVPGMWAAATMLQDGFDCNFCEVFGIEVPAKKKEQEKEQEEEHEFDEESALAYQKWMDDTTRPQMEKFLTTIDLSPYKSFVDLAAGSGLVGLEVARLYPSMEVMLTELPQGAELLRKHYVPKDSSSIKVIEGDAFTDDLPKADVISMGNFVRHWVPEEKMTVMMNKVYASLNPGGMFIIFEKCLTDSKDGPPQAMMLDMMMLYYGSQIRSFAEYKQLVEKYGFTDCKVVKIENCEYDAVYCKKPK